MLADLIPEDEGNSIISRLIIESLHCLIVYLSKFYTAYNFILWKVPILDMKTIVL